MTVRYASLKSKILHFFVDLNSMKFLVLYGLITKSAHYPITWCALGCLTHNHVLQYTPYDTIEAGPIEIALQANTIYA